MEDDQLEEALNRYRPRRPDSSLRSRVLSATPVSVPLRVVDWVLLGAVASLAIAAFWPQQPVDRTLDQVATVYRERLDDTTLALGGDLDARQLAVIVVNAGAAEDEQ
jgi:hypothetical protein